VSLDSFAQLGLLSPAPLGLTPGVSAGDVSLGWVQAALLAAAALLLGVGVGVGALRLLSIRMLARAREEREEVLRRARDDAETLTARAEVDAERVRIDKQRDFEEWADETRSDLRDQERRLAKREDMLDRKLETLAMKEEALAKQAQDQERKEKKLRDKTAAVDQTLEEQKNELLRIGRMSREEAREAVLGRIEEDVREDAAELTRKIIDDAEEQANEKAREITLLAVQRLATEYTAESTVRTVNLPSDDMKGRIIGREGRNIRAIERATGVDVIVDDTPGIIIVSSFDKVRQHVAAESLDRLMKDGRVHPSRIEQVVSQVEKETQERIMKAGKEAAHEVKVRRLHPKILEAMGKLSFRVSYGQNVLRHSVEVAFLAQMIADQLGLDGALARRSGFLHDIGKAMDHEMEGGHPKIGMDFAKAHGEKGVVLNAIGGHHSDIPSTSFYTPIVMAADAISGSRPGARRESYEKYVQRLDALQEIAKKQQGVRQAYAIQAGREIRVMVDAKKVSDDEALVIAKRIADEVSEEITFPGEIQVTVLRETRAIEYAR